ncbi:MAG: hypothetical protein ACFB13_10570 [Kiloniellaceae bacterium]
MHACRPEAGQRGAAAWLGYAAAPAFAAMALLTALRGDAGADTLCLTSRDAWPLNGMTTMYLLMSLFHAAPWLTLLSGRRPESRRR